MRAVKRAKDRRTFPEIGRFVRQLREDKSMTQVVLAEKAGMRNERVGLVEKGTNARMEQYDKIARALGFKSGALEMFRTGGDDLLNPLLRTWVRLNQEERKDVLEQAKRYLAIASERDAT